jgi:DNA-binding CsgD family transcriptional regulator
VACNVSDLILARYEREMDDDPLLSHARSTGQPAYNRDRMSAPEWEETAVFRHAYATHAMRHVAELPITGEGRIVGALHFAASRPDHDFTADELRLAEAIAGVLGVAICRIRAGSRSEGELAQTRSALESGAQGMLHAHSDRMPTGELVTVLELARERPGLDRRLLACVTPREAQVATLVVEGLSDREIAEELVLGRYTVSQYVKRVYEKLGVDSRVTLTRLLLGAPPTARRG